ncbi:hypothetical protein FOS14_16535 [Skermania sp. ID1734]|uniref:MBL fold metallo-hydrolase n=1 Tax=Skermania sp. ID1734 TaxID=2597516 RepID=UPI001180850B|nr:MBL fold metallo-hydrolase [Skermania sp. ID1734]TSD96649.1 hypothetical protein FOS14_16535 [Skermania sp. ID1734]
MTVSNTTRRRFRNTEPSSIVSTSGQSSILRDLLTRGRVGRPSRPVPLTQPELPAEAAQLAATWFGHASVLIEVDGHRVLTDPVWSERVSPTSLVGPTRMHPVPSPLESLPALDAIIISHDHYDHLDKATIKSLNDSQQAPFVVPLGIADYLRRWGVADDRIIELDWGASATVGGLTITCTEARHFSGRGLVRNTTLWASWVIAGPTRRVYFGGDTGYSRCFAEIGGEHGPFDLTLLPIGAYDAMWPDIHMNPEEAVRAHRDLSAGAHADFGTIVPIHWATYNLAFHPWAEPVHRLLAAAAESGVSVRVPQPGQRIDFANPGSNIEWWAGI